MGRGQFGDDFVDMGVAVVCLRIGRSCEWEEGYGYGSWMKWKSLKTWLGLLSKQNFACSNFDTWRSRTSDVQPPLSLLDITPHLILALASFKSSLSALLWLWLRHPVPFVRDLARSYTYLEHWNHAMFYKGSENPTSLNVPVTQDSSSILTRTLVFSWFQHSDIKHPTFSNRKYSQTEVYHHLDFPAKS